MKCGSALMVSVLSCAMRGYLPEVSSGNCTYNCYKPRLHLGEAFHDLGQLTYRLWSLDSLLVMVPYMPFVGVAAAYNDDIHAHYYCHHHHKNRHTGSSSLYDMAEIMTGMTLGTLAACSFVVDECLQRTAQLYAISLPITWATKSLLKQVHWDGNYRPFNEKFEKKKVYGGFPSGHILEMTYATILFGLRMGPAAALPLALSTAVVAIAFVKNNRHTLWQEIVGAALGTAFAYAAYGALEYEPEGYRVTLGIKPDFQHQHLVLCGEYRF